MNIIETILFEYECYDFEMECYDLRPKLKLLSLLETIVTSKTKTI